MFSLNDDDEVGEARAITPPGPPTRIILRDPNLTMGERSSGKVDHMTTKEALTRKTTGVMFKDVESNPTDPTVDPPPRVCQNCWRKGHYRAKCSKKIIVASCENCGRKYQTVATCPRCADGYRRFLLRGKKSDKKNFQRTRDEAEMVVVDDRTRRIQR